MKQQLIVEGSNDIHVITHLLMAKSLVINGYESAFRYKDEFVTIGGNKQKALKSLNATLKSEDAKDRLGIVIDADSETAEAAIDTWHSVANILRQNGYKNVPTRPNPNGTIVTQDDKPQVGVWIMPDNQREGYLEHFFEQLIDSQDEFLTEAATLTEGFVTNQRNRFKTIHLQKAKLKTWLAWQDDPESPMGLALRDYPRLGYILLDSPLSNAFIEWLKLTFDIKLKEEL